MKPNSAWGGGGGEAGPNWLSEDRAQGEDLEYLAGRWGLTFSQWLFWRTVEFYHRQVGFVRIEEPERTFIQTRTGLKFPLAFGLATTVQYNLDWDAKPQPGKDELDANAVRLAGLSMVTAAGLESGLPGGETGSPPPSGSNNGIG